MSFSDCVFISDGNAKRSSPSDEYAVWISAGSLSFDNCEFTGYRGSKIHEAYGTDVTSVSFNQCYFHDLSKKPGLAIGTVNSTTSISIKSCTFENCQAGKQGLYKYETDTPVTSFHFEDIDNTVQ